MNEAWSMGFFYKCIFKAMLEFLEEKEYEILKNMLEVMEETLGEALDEV